MTTALALLASVLWGTSDFLGGTASRRMPASGVVAVSQAFALAGLLVVALVGGSFGDPTGYVGWALAAGLVGLVALTAFYAALASGRMGVVAPIAALGVVVPVVVGIAQGDRPNVWQGLGVVLAFVGVVLASGPELRHDGVGERPSRRPYYLAAVAAVGFGAVLVCVAHGARSSTVMTLLVMRATSVGVFVTAALAGRVSLATRPADVPLLVAVGAGDVGANAAMAVASTSGLLSIVAVLSSLYPAVTVLLARPVHGERLMLVQSAGVLAALAGVTLIASGGGVSG
jgi:drug/metabolite transporter (DMT)-like permease